MATDAFKWLLRRMRRSPTLLVLHHPKTSCRLRLISDSSFCWVRLAVVLLLDCLGFEVGFAIHLSKRVNRCLIALRFACERTRSFITPLDAERSAKDANGADYGGVVYE